MTADSGLSTIMNNPLRMSKKPLPKRGANNQVLTVVATYHFMKPQRTLLLLAVLWAAATGCAALVGHWTFENGSFFNTLEE